MSPFNVRTITHHNFTQLKQLKLLRLSLPWLAAVLLMIIFLIVKYTGNQQDAATRSTAKIFPHVFMTQVNMREFAQNGALHYQLKTPLIRHYQPADKPSANDYTLFALPQILFLGDDETPAWYITAQEGRNDNQGNIFTLSNNVLAQQTSSSQSVTSLTTSELRLNTHEQFAETDKAVTMRNAKTQLKTQGLRAYITQDRIELLSHVTGTYEP